MNLRTLLPVSHIHYEIAILAVFSGCVSNTRTSHGKLSVSQVQSIPNIFITKEEVWRFCGYSAIVHDYELMSRKGDMWSVTFDYGGVDLYGVHRRGIYVRPVCTGRSDTVLSLEPLL